MLNRSWFGYVALLLTVAALGCDRVQLLAPTSSTISVSADSRTLPTGGSTQVTAIVMESSGSPVQNGTFVRFATTLGRVDPTEVETRGGIAITTFFAGEVSGTADVRAISGAATGSAGTTQPGGTAATAGNVVTIQVGAAAAAAVTLSASSTTVPAAGGTITVTASVFDASGNRMRGVQVSFSTTAGNLSFSAVTTNENGQASVELTTNRTATVTARVGAGGTATDTARTATLVVNVASVNNLSLAVTPSPAIVGQAVTLTVTPTVGANNVAPRVVVTWGDGAQSDLGVVAAARTASHSYSSAGTFTITATGTAEGETTSASIAVTISPQPAINVILTAPPPLHTKCSPVTFTATVTPATESIRSFEWRIVGGADTATITTTGGALTRVFRETGLKTVDVVVTTTDGRSGNAQTQINVVEPTVPEGSPPVTCG